MFKQIVRAWWVRRDRDFLADDVFRALRPVGEGGFPTRDNESAAE